MNNIRKSRGSTPSERYLAALCERSFLGLWSYPNIYRDQGIGSNKGSGKEICDLLVLSGDDIIIFSDKSCEFPTSGCIDKDWTRWFKRAIFRSAKQVYGAERWLRFFPDRVFIDADCKSRLPVKLPVTERTHFHRIIVARGVTNRSRGIVGGTGSLIIKPELVGSAHTNPESPSYSPMHIGQIDPKRGFVHVLDDITLNVLLKELDTVTDFLRYLRRKEELISRGGLRIAEGEENLLAVYLKETDDYGEHCFQMPPRAEALTVPRGGWDDLRTHPQFIAKKEADRKSYLWDRIVQDFSKHALGGTLVNAHPTSLEEVERALRIMATEPRFSRRFLCSAMLERLEISLKNETSSRTLLSCDDERVAYVFQFAPTDEENYEAYREKRRLFLNAYCFVVAEKHRNFKSVVGLATESGFHNAGQSMDICLVQVEEWDEEKVDEARALQRELGILQPGRIRRTPTHDDEYPDVQEPTIVIQEPAGQPPRSGAQSSRRRKIGRNDPCPCGSGLKFKKCCGRRTETA